MTKINYLKFISSLKIYRLKELKATLDDFVEVKDPRTASPRTRIEPLCLPVSVHGSLSNDQIKAHQHGKQTSMVIKNRTNTRIITETWLFMMQSLHFNGSGK